MVVLLIRTGKNVDNLITTYGFFWEIPQANVNSAVAAFWASGLISD
jgi:hypothetical protein